MILAGKKNHYNVKFLKGYWHSISVKDSKIILKDCHDPFSEPSQEEWFAKNMPYDIDSELWMDNDENEDPWTFVENLWIVFHMSIIVMTSFITKPIKPT